MYSLSMLFSSDYCKIFSAINEFIMRSSWWKMARPELFTTVCVQHYHQTLFFSVKKGLFMEGRIQKSELQLELSRGFDNYEVKREGCARKQSPQRLLRDVKQL